MFFWAVLEEMIQFDQYFSDGWLNHQLVEFVSCWFHMISAGLLVFVIQELSMGCLCHASAWSQCAGPLWGEKGRRKQRATRRSGSGRTLRGDAEGPRVEWMEGASGTEFGWMNSRMNQRWRDLISNGFVLLMKFNIFSMHIYIYNYIYVCIYALCAYECFVGDFRTE